MVRAAPRIPPIPVQVINTAGICFHVIATMMQLLEAWWVVCMRHLET